MKLPALTMIETVLALLVMALLFEGLLLVCPSPSKEGLVEQETNLQLALTQLNRQNYQVNHVHKEEVELQKPVGHKLHLKVAQEKLILAGNRHGQVVLLQGINQLMVRNFGTYQMLTLVLSNQKTISGLLFLPGTKQYLKQYLKQGE